MKSSRIEVTEYSRPEAFSPVSRVRACRTTDQHHWKVYCTFGPNWVWNSRTEEWIIITSINPGDPDDDFLMTKEEALQVLETVPSKEETKI
jgi:hypothetical protein